MPKNILPTMLDRSCPPKVHPIEGLVMPEVEKTTLPNNTELFIIPGGSQDVNQLMLVFDGGKVDCRVGVTAQIASELMREAAGNRTGGEVAEVLDYNGAVVRIGANHHHMTVDILTLNDRTSDVLTVVSDMLLRPAMREEDFITIRDKVARQVALMRSRVDYLGDICLNRLMMGAGNQMIGDETPEDVMSIELGEVVDFHHKVFVGRRCRAILAGKISKEIRSRVEAFLMQLGDTPPYESVYKQFVPSEPQIVREVLPSAVQAAISMGIPGPRRTDTDFVPLRNAVTALGGYFGSRLMTSIREEKGLTYGISAYLLGYKEGSIITIKAQADNAYVDEVIDEVRKEISKLASEPMGDEELRRLRQNLSTSLVEILDSPFSIADFYRSLIPLGIDPHAYFSERAALTEALTADSILEAARRYLDPKALRISVVS